jgi:hypothetical protein
MAIVRKEKRTEQKEEERKWELGMNQKSSHATPQNQPLFPVQSQLEATEQQCTVGDIQTVSHKPILHVSQGINGFPSLGESKSDTVNDQRLLQACFSHSRPLHT